jgi:predicted nuclease of predicted toxin-antitoxin system
MKLLLDENLSRRIIPLIDMIYPKSSQVAYLGLESANDQFIWDYAKTNHYTIVTKDSDFHEMSVLYGHPPKLIWLKCGNQTKLTIAQKLIQSFDAIEQFMVSEHLHYLEIY